MADQEFPASFGADIDGSGVSRLQKILAGSIESGVITVSVTV